ncbi:hypothetical protein SNOG_12606 [Parastagonospora nodorum SN15]|uniref:Cytochrome P450 n=1 Tax=Phaeosphaeria nodorum (strain SN15 / ATCC MYA-4574 / FGSC 10173) TaxID=321614 RepID=Q0U6K8_PHANO|nr:hypothetical protein SNOG_12606 [Parastagonospora nodorum SN15]EAT79904.1 hypothetical protein SNOG_12606 [Parastagonospora nodorum SN15]
MTGCRELSEPLRQTQTSLSPVAWDELVMNTSSLVVAGAETSATTVAATLYLLLANSEVYEHLRTEVRSVFKTSDEITLSAVNNLEYSLACLDEAMRMLPAVPGGLPRVVPSGGRVLGGNFVPQGTIVATWHWALYHNKKFFKNPFEFRPERFLGAESFTSDAPRLIFEFDMELTDESRDWLHELRPYNLWYKAPLYVRIKSHKTEE